MTRAVAFLRRIDDMMAFRSLDPWAFAEVVEEDLNERLLVTVECALGKLAGLRDVLDALDQFAIRNTHVVLTNSLDMTFLPSHLVGFVASMVNEYTDDLDGLQRNVETALRRYAPDAAYAAARSVRSIVEGIHEVQGVLRSHVFSATRQMCEQFVPHARESCDGADAREKARWQVVIRHLERLMRRPQGLLDTTPEGVLAEADAAAAKVPPPPPPVPPLAPARTAAAGGAHPPQRGAELVDQGDDKEAEAPSRFSFLEVD